MNPEKYLPALGPVSIFGEDYTLEELARFIDDYAAGKSWFELSRHLKGNYHDPARQAIRMRDVLQLPERDAKKLSLEDAIALVRAQGMDVRPPQAAIGDNPQVPGEPWEGTGELRLGVISCTHLGSRTARVDALDAFYQTCHEEGVESVIHCGDLTEGSGRMHPGQPFHMSVFGFDATADYVANEYPGLPGITTYILEGNHDRSWFKDNGSSIVRAICDRRGDFTYLGVYQNIIPFGPFRVCVSHQKGGPKYGASKLQQNVQNLPRSLSVDLYTIGHFHNPAHLPDIDGVIGLQVGCFQDQTEFERQNQLYPRVGGWIISISRGVGGSWRHTATWHGWRAR